MLREELLILLLLQKLERLNNIHDHAKCITTTEFNESFGGNFDAKIKQAKLINYLVKTSRQN